MVEEFQMPGIQDNLFKDFNTDDAHNAILSSGMDKFLLFSEGYKIAAKKLYEQLDKSGWDNNMLVYPLIFLNRHFLELRLKELISGLNFTLYHEYKFPDGHCLKTLWDTFKTLLLQLKESSIKKEDFSNTERLIKEFISIDPQSFSFRYPVDKTKDRKPTIHTKNIDLENFMIVMKKLYNFFEEQSDLVYYYIDCTEEFINIMRSEYMSSMYENILNKENQPSK